jgi:inorganic pyrophosphatase
MKIPSALADPSQLIPTGRDEGIVQVIVETPKRSRNKFGYDPQQKVFTLRRVLPAGMAFPLDFGFLPQTEAPDGDPLDVLPMMDEAAFPGIAVRARPIGILEGEQAREDGTKSRNDRLLAVAEASQDYAEMTEFEQAPKGKVIAALQYFASVS